MTKGVLSRKAAPPHSLTGLSGMIWHRRKRLPRIVEDASPTTQIAPPSIAVVAMTSRNQEFVTKRVSPEVLNSRRFGSHLRLKRCSTDWAVPGKSEKRIRERGIVRNIPVEWFLINDTDSQKF
jgi:hypothetical protein